MNHAYWVERGMQPGDILKVQVMYLPQATPSLTPAPNIVPPRPPAPQLALLSATVTRMESDALYVAFVAHEQMEFAVLYKQIIEWHPRSEFVMPPQ